MVALAQPLVELLYLGGRFSAQDSRECAAYFAVFSVATFLWCAQAIYARAFYAAGNTFAPMAAGTVVTLVSWPIYASLNHWQGAMGLAMASNIGIGLQTLTIALLLHQRRMVSLASLDYAEMGRCLLAAVTAGAAVWGTMLGLHALVGQPGGAHLRMGARTFDVSELVVGSAVWMLIAVFALEKTGSALPRVAVKRLRLR
jgi:putative peptidoglycan lipid II flippase